MTESLKIKLAEDGKELDGSLANFSFNVGQVVWCYWQTANEKEKKYFEADVTEIWDDSVIVEETLQREADHESLDAVLDGVEGKKNFTLQPRLCTKVPHTQ